MSKDLIIGIDFGTSTTVVRYRYKDSAEIKAIHDPVSNNTLVIPSLITYESDENGKVINTYFGTASSQIIDGRKRIKGKQKHIKTFKLALKYDHGSSEFTEREVYLNDFFGFIYQTLYDQILNTHAYDDVIVNLSVPAKWNDDARKIMVEKFTKAGFGSLESAQHKVRIETVDEPTAAMSHLLNNSWRRLYKAGVLTPGKKATCLLLDMGAGTSDISMFQIGLKQSSGNDYTLGDAVNLHNYPRFDNPKFCGGSEIDTLFTDYLRERIYRELGDEGLKVVKRTLKTAYIKEWKENVLSNDLAMGQNTACTTIPGSMLSALDTLSQMDDKFATKYTRFLENFSIGRAAFEEYTSNHWRALNSLINEAVTEYQTKYGVYAADFDFILFTGGHSSWYCVKNLFNGIGINGIGKDNGFSKIKLDPETRIAINPHPSETVADGICVINQEFKIPFIATNNIFLQLNVDEEIGEISQFVESGSELPILKEAITSNCITVNKRLYDSHIFNIVIKIFEGTSQQSSKISCKQFTYDSHDLSVYLGRTLGLSIKIIETLGNVLTGGSIPEFNPSVSFSFQVVVNAEIAKDNRLYIQGRILVDGEEKETFTEADLVAIE